MHWKAGTQNASFCEWRPWTPNDCQSFSKTFLFIYFFKRQTNQLLIEPSWRLVHLNKFNMWVCCPLVNVWRTLVPPKKWDGSLYPFNLSSGQFAATLPFIIWPNYVDTPTPCFLKQVSKDKSDSCVLTLDNQRCIRFNVSSLQSNLLNRQSWLETHCVWIWWKVLLRAVGADLIKLGFSGGFLKTQELKWSIQKEGAQRFSSHVQYERNNVFVFNIKACSHILIDPQNKSVNPKMCIST